MYIIFSNNEYLDMYTDSRIPFEFINPMFDEVGSHTNSFNIPRTNQNNKNLKIYDALNSHVASEVDVRIKLKTLKFEAQITVMEVYENEIKVYLAFHTGYFNKKNKNRLMQEIDYGGDHEVTGTPDQRYQYFKRSTGWNPQNDDFAIFPVYMPHYYNGSESEETELKVFTDEEGEPIPLTLYDFWNKINKGIVNKCWTDSVVSTWHKIYWHWSQFELGDLVEYRLGVIIPFPFLTVVIKKIFSYLGYNIIDNIFDEDEHLSKMVIFNNYDLASWEPWLITKWNLKNHVPNIKVSEFFKQLRDYLGVFHVVGLQSNTAKITSYKTIFNDANITDITDRCDKDSQIKEISNQRLHVTIGTYHYTRPAILINGYYKLLPYPHSSPLENYAANVISAGERPNWFKYELADDGNYYWVEIDKEFADSQLEELNAIKLETKAHTLEQTITRYYHDDELFNDYSYSFNVSIPQASNIEGSHIFNDHSNPLDRLILLYYNGPYTSGNVSITGYNYGNSYPIGGYGEVWGDKSLHLDSDGVAEKWQIEYFEWLRNRRRLVTKTVNWTEADLTEFFFIKKFKIDNTQYFVKKIKGYFTPGEDIEFTDTEFYSI